MLNVFKHVHPPDRAKHVDVRISSKHRDQVNDRAWGSGAMPHEAHVNFAGEYGTGNIIRARDLFKSLLSAQNTAHAMEVACGDLFCSPDPLHLRFVGHGMNSCEGTH